MGKRFSARELANMKLPGLSARRDGCSLFITRIREVSPELVSPRKGRGGGYVVDIAALPQAARDELARRNSPEQAPSPDIADQEVFHAVLQRMQRDAERMQRDVAFLLAHAASNPPCRS